MSQDYVLDDSIQTVLVAQLKTVVTETLQEYKESGVLKAFHALQCDNVASFVENIACSLPDTVIGDEDTDLRLKILLQSKQILVESKHNTLQRLLRLIEENSSSTVEPKVTAPSTDENSVNFTAASTKTSDKKRKRAALTAHSTEDIKVKMKVGFKAQRYQGARVFAFEDSEESEESPSKRARTEEQPRTEQQEDSDVLMALRPFNEELADDVDLFALDSESESRQLVGSRECAIDVDLSKFNFERLEEKSSQPEHISSQPGRSMDVKKKLQQIESYLSEANEPQESYEHDELPGLLAYQLSPTDYAAMVSEEETKSKEDD